MTGALWLIGYIVTLAEADRLAGQFRLDRAAKRDTDRADADRARRREARAAAKSAREQQ